MPLQDEPQTEAVVEEAPIVSESTVEKMTQPDVEKSMERSREVKVFDEVIQSPNELAKQQSAQSTPATGNVNGSFNTSLLDDMNNMSMVSSSMGVGLSDFG